MDIPKEFIQIFQAIKVKIGHKEDGRAIDLGVRLLDVILRALIQGKMVIIQAKDAKDGPTDFLFREEIDIVWLDLLLNREKENWTISDCPYCRGLKRLLFKIYKPIYGALVVVIKFLKLDSRVFIVNYCCEKCLNTGRIFGVS